MLIVWRMLLSRESIGGRSSRGFVGTSAISYGTRWVRTLLALEVLKVSSSPDLLIACFTVGFWR